MKTRFALAMTAILVLAAGDSLAGTVVWGNSQTIQNGPTYDLIGRGTATLLAGETYTGTSFIVQLKLNPQVTATIPGAMDLTFPPPTPGGGAAGWKGDAQTVVKGTYTGICTMNYVDAQKNPQMAKGQGNIVA